MQNEMKTFSKTASDFKQQRNLLNGKYFCSENVLLYERIHKHWMYRVFRRKYNLSIRTYGERFLFFCVYIIHSLLCIVYPTYTQTYQTHFPYYFVQCIIQHIAFCYFSFGRKSAFGGTDHFPECLWAGALNFLFTSHSGTIADK